MVRYGTEIYRTDRWSIWIPVLNQRFSVTIQPIPASNILLRVYNSSKELATLDDHGRSRNIKKIEGND